MDISREEAIESGELIDYSDIAGEIGFRWHVAVSETLECKLQETLPDERNMRVLEGMLTSAVYALLTECHKRLAEAAASPELRGQSRLPIEIAMPWRADGASFQAVLTVGPDDSGGPCFTLFHPSEL